MKSNFKHGIPASARLPKTILIALATCFYFNGTAALAGAGDDLVNTIAADGITESNREVRVTKALAAGAPVDYIANPAANKTPLIDASYYCRPGVARILVDKGANVNHRNNVNKTALDYALQRKCWPIATLVLKTGKVSDAKAIVNSVNHESNTYLHFAARDGDNQAVKLLLDAGANPNAIGFANSTPLHFAAGGNGNSDTVRLLVDAGALIRSRNASGKSPEELANTFGNMNVAGRLNYLDQQLQKNSGNPAAAVATTKTPINPAAPAAPNVSSDWSGRLFNVSIPGGAGAALTFSGPSQGSMLWTGATAPEPITYKITASSMSITRDCRSTRLPTCSQVWAGTISGNSMSGSWSGTGGSGTWTATERARVFDISLGAALTLTGAGQGSMLWPGNVSEPVTYNITGTSISITRDCRGTSKAATCSQTWTGTMSDNRISGSWSGTGGSGSWTATERK